MNIIVFGVDVRPRHAVFHLIRQYRFCLRNDVGDDFFLIGIYAPRRRRHRFRGGLFVRGRFLHARNELDFGQIAVLVGVHADKLFRQRFRQARRRDQQQRG